MSKVSKKQTDGSISADLKEKDPYFDYQILLLNLFLFKF